MQNFRLWEEERTFCSYLSFGLIRQHEHAICKQIFSGRPLINFWYIMFCVCVFIQKTRLSLFTLWICDILVQMGTGARLTNYEKLHTKRGSSTILIDIFNNPDKLIIKTNKTIRVHYALSLGQQLFNETFLLF